MPALEALQARLTAAHTAAFGISVDSLYCHANWAVSLGGISFPLLADFHPKGAVASAYGVYLGDAGIADRATVLVDAGGVVRHASSVTPAGERDISELAGLCEQVDHRQRGPLGDLPDPEGIRGEVTLFVKSKCGFSLRALNARANLHLQDKVRVRNVTEEAGALQALRDLSGKDQAPCLVTGGEAILEADAIVKHLVVKTQGYWD